MSQYHGCHEVNAQFQQLDIVRVLTEPQAVRSGRTVATAAFLRLSVPCTNQAKTPTL